MDEVDFTHKLVLVVRKDLKLSPGKLAAQAAHAAVECALKAKSESKKSFDAWWREGQKKVVVGARDLNHLKELRAQAEGKKLVTALVTDAGKTEVEPGTVTALGIGPGSNAQLDAVTGTLPLL